MYILNGKIDRKIKLFKLILKFAENRNVCLFIFDLYKYQA